MHAFQSRSSLLRRAALCGAVLSAILVGCGAMRAADARHDSLTKQMTELTYPKPIEQVWPVARQLVFEKGFTIPQGAGAEAGGWALETAWRQKGGVGLNDRLLVQGLKSGDAACKVVITRQTGDSFDGSRDVYLELELLRKVDPERAKAVEAEAERESDKARGA